MWHAQVKHIVRMFERSTNFRGFSCEKKSLIRTLILLRQFWFTTSNLLRCGLYYGQDSDKKNYYCEEIKLKMIRKGMEEPTL